jgi:hypothetical protein
VIVQVVVQVVVHSLPCKHAQKNGELHARESESHAGDPGPNEIAHIVNNSPDTPGGEVLGCGINCVARCANL